MVVYLMQDVELAAGMLQQTILMSFHHNCPPRVALSPKRVFKCTVILKQYKPNKHM